MIGGNVAFRMGWWGANQSGSCSEIAQEIAREVAQESARGNCSGMVEGTKLFKKDSDWWKCSI